jgi:signal transduction histidine kinase
MSDDGMARAFEQLFTTKLTGLGLAMVYGPVSQNNGVVDLASVVESGTTVEVLLLAV